MAKLTIFYHPNDKTSLNLPLKVKIDDEIKFEVPKGKSETIDVEMGNHNIKMYFPGFSEADCCGCVDSDLLVDQEHNFYIYKAPVVLKNEGKLVKVNSEKAFRKSVVARNIMIALLFAALIVYVALINR